MGGNSTQTPVFTQEGPQFYQQAYQRNAPYATTGSYQTPLASKEEQQFRSWVANRGVPFDPNQPIQDYDMRGFWKERPKQADAWRQGSHFPDTYKTPYDTTFSAESKYATKANPFKWFSKDRSDDLIDRSTGQVVFSVPKNGR